MIALAALVLAAPRVLDVDTLIERHVALTGQVVRVAGWMSRICQPLDCVLYATPDTKRRARFISLGSNRAFDAEVARRQAGGRHVVVEAKVTSRCWPAPPGADYLSLCTDRAGQIIPHALIDVRPAPAPASE